jgi:hypothetical protein
MDNLFKSYCQGSLLSFVAYLVYLETNPKIGGIIIRPGSDMKRHFNLTGVIPMLKYPFQSLDFWYPTMWDLNFIIFTQVGAAIYIGGTTNLFL